MTEQFEKMILLPKEEYAKLTCQDPLKNNDLLKEMSDLKRKKIGKSEKWTNYRAKLDTFLQESEKSREPIKMNLIEMNNVSPPTVRPPPRIEDQSLHAIKIKEELPREQQKKARLLFEKMNAGSMAKTLKGDLIDYVINALSTNQSALDGYEDFVHLLRQYKVRVSSLINPLYVAELKGQRARPKVREQVGEGAPFSTWKKFRFSRNGARAAECDV